MTVTDAIYVCSGADDQMVIITVCVCERNFRGYATYEASSGRLALRYLPLQAQLIQGRSHLYFDVEEDTKTDHEQTETTLFGGQEYS